MQCAIGYTEAIARAHVPYNQAELFGYSKESIKELWRLYLVVEKAAPKQQALRSYVYR